MEVKETKFSECGLIVAKDPKAPRSPVCGRALNSDDKTLCWNCTRVRHHKK